MRLHHVQAAESHRFRLKLNRYPKRWPIGIAAQRGTRVWSLVWSGPASISDEKWAMRDADAPCPWCNDEGIVHTHDGEIIGPCECVTEVQLTDGDAG